MLQESFLSYIKKDKENSVSKRAVYISGNKAVKDNLTGLNYYAPWQAALHKNYIIYYNVIWYSTI